MPRRVAYTAITMKLQGAISKKAPKKAPKKALVTAVTKGFWTPNKISMEILNKTQAEVCRLQQMQAEMQAEMEVSQSMLMLMSGTEVQTDKVHPKTLEATELTRKIQYIHVIMEVMMKLGKTKSFEDPIKFLHYLRDAAWKKGMFQEPKQEEKPTIFDVDIDGEIVSHPTAGDAAFYTPPPELLDAAKVFFRVRRYKANQDLKGMRVVEIDKDTSLIHLTNEDRLEPAFGVPNQLIKVVGNSDAMPEWAIIVHGEEALGLFHRDTKYLGLLIKGGKAVQTCKYDAY